MSLHERIVLQMSRPSLSEGWNRINLTFKQLSKHSTVTLCFFCSGHVVPCCMILNDVIIEERCLADLQMFIGCNANLITPCIFWLHAHVCYNKHLYLPLLRVEAQQVIWLVREHKVHKHTHTPTNRFTLVSPLTADSWPVQWMHVLLV